MLKTKTVTCGIYCCTALYSTVYCLIVCPVFDVTSHVTLMMTGAKVGLFYRLELISTFKLEHKTRLCQKCPKTPRAIPKPTVFCLLCFVIFLRHESSDFCSPGVCMKRLYVPFPPLNSIPPFISTLCILSKSVSYLCCGYLRPHNSSQINSFDVAQSQISSLRL